MRTLYNAFAEHVARRRAILTAVTSDADSLLAKCDPNRPNVCLYGLPDGRWEVCLPSEEVPSELPEPVLGINYARDGMTREEWLSLVAIYSDSWLMALAFFSGARMCKEEREEMFNLINQLPTCYEIVSGARKTEEWEISAENALHDMRSVLDHQDPNARYLGNSDDSDVGQSDDIDSSSENESEIGISEPSGLDDPDDPDDMPPMRAVVHEQPTSEKDEGDSDIEQEEPIVTTTAGWAEEDGEPCPSCGKLYEPGEFWIACDFCDEWYCGTCAGMDEENAQEVPQWKCTECCNGDKDL